MRPCPDAQLTPSLRMPACRQALEQSFPELQIERVEQVRRVGMEPSLLVARAAWALQEQPSWQVLGQVEPAG